MCTAIHYKTYFGRNLDLEYTYDETVTIMPRNYIFDGYAIIGMAYVKNDYPLYYDGINEKGLGMAGLNFPFNAQYNDYKEGKDNVSPFEFIPYVLSKCNNVLSAKELLCNVNLINKNFSEDLPLSPLHWMIADKESSIVVESVNDGLKVYDNPCDVLTNNPPFDKQLENYKKYSQLSPDDKPDAGKDEYFSGGTGATGLPGDWSSMSRFARAVFVRFHSGCEKDELSGVGQFFHMLSAVAMPEGSVRVNVRSEITQYSSCCNLNEGKYYYTTYKNHRITCVDMCKENLDGKKLINYPIAKEESIFRQN